MHSTDPIKNNDKTLEFLYAFDPTPEEIKFPMEIKKLVKVQNEDMQNNAKFQKLFKDNNNITIHDLQGKNINFLNNKIIFPKCLQKPVIKWYHHFYVTWGQVVSPILLIKQ